jgi:serralysin
LRGRAGVAAGAGLAALAALALLLGTGHTPGKATAATLDPADLSLTKSDSPDPVATGATLTYTIRVHNAGPDPATNTVVTDGLPGGVTFVSATASAGSCDRSGSKVTCDLGTVTTTVDRTITIKTTVKKKSGEMTNSASVASDVTDPSPANNLDSELTKISNPKPIECAGQPVTIFGTLGPDTLIGTVGDDVILADDGDDLVFGFQGRDLICGGKGSDAIRSGAGNDLVLGGRGSDFVRGRRGDDELRGNRGRDRLRGGGGDDLLAGGRGFDRCRGGSGIDIKRSCER